MRTSAPAWFVAGSYSLSPATFPRKTVMEALGRVNVVPEPAVIVVAIGGLSGSAWLLIPSLIQTYCSLPNVTNVTGPENDAFLFLESSNTTRRVWGLVSSRFTSINDQFPSGRWTAYVVTNTLPSLSLMSEDELN